MKKLLAFAVVVASFVACNDSADSSETTTTDTSTVIKADTATVVTETTVTTDTLNKVVVADTTKKS